MSAEGGPGIKIVTQVGPWGMIPVWVLLCRPGGGDLATLISLRSFADKVTGKAWPKVKTIADRACVSERTAERAIKFWRDADVIETEQVIEAGSISGCIYRLRDIPTPAYMARFTPEEDGLGSDRSVATDKPVARPATDLAGQGTHQKNTPKKNPSGSFSSPNAAASGDPKKARKPPTKRQLRNASPEIVQLCNLLADCIAPNIDKRPEVTETWRDEIRKLIDIDGRTQLQVEWMIRWATKDKFWKANILSAPTLREKFDQLVAKVKAEKAAKGAEGKSGARPARKSAEQFNAEADRLIDWAETFDAATAHLTPKQRSAAWRASVEAGALRLPDDIPPNEAAPAMTVQSARVIQGELAS